jgi:hypothetical protein
MHFGIQKAWAPVTYWTYKSNQPVRLHIYLLDLVAIRSHDLQVSDYRHLLDFTNLWVCCHLSPFSPWHLLDLFVSFTVT